MKKDSVMQELQEIRANHYDETKNLQPAELADYINREAINVEHEISLIRESHHGYDLKP